MSGSQKERIPRPKRERSSPQAIADRQAIKRSMQRRRTTS